jgi:hypothetical protein
VSSRGLALAQEQFVLVDSTFTMTTQNTMQSQYEIAPLPAAPASWKSPVDWSRGSMHVRFEILEKPSNAKTLTNVCFETAGVLTCQPYPPPYATKGVFTSDDRLITFWQYSVFDWTKKLDHVIVVIKDENGKIVQGNTTFYPSKMRVTVTVIPPGKAYKDSPVTEQDEDGGMPLVAPKADGGLAPRAAGTSGDTTGVAGARGAGLTATDAGPARNGASATGTAGLSALQVADAGTGRSIRDYVDSGSTCAVSPAYARRSHALLAGFGLALACFAVRRRRR